MIETKEGAVKMLRCKHAQILTEEGLRFITGKSKAQQSLPEDINLEDRIRRLVFDKYKSYGGKTEKLKIVLQQVLDENPDVGESGVFKSVNARDSKSLVNLSQALIEQRQGDEGTVERVGEKPYKFKWKPQGDMKSLNAN